MSKKKSLRRWIWLIASAIVLGLIFYNIRQSPEWRNFSVTRLWHSLLSAQPGLLVLVACLVYFSYLIRAWRWGFLMAPMKKASLWVLYVGQILGFSAIFLVGRPGELVRPAYIARKETVTFSSQMAVWLFERIFDSIFLVFLFSIALFFAPSEMTNAGHHALTILHEASYVMFGLTVLAIYGLLVYRMKTQQATEWLMKKSSFLPERAHHHLEHFLKSFSEGLQVVRSLRYFLASAALTAALWVINATVFWISMKSLNDAQLHAMSWLAAALVMFVASLGLVIQFPGIGGGYQVGAILAMTAVFGIEADVATSAAILIWIMMSLPLVVMALGMLAHEGISIRRLGAITQEEESEEEHEPTLKER